MNGSLRTPLRLLGVAVVTFVVGLTIVCGIAFFPVLFPSVDHRNTEQVMLELAQIGNVMRGCQSHSTAPPSSLAEATASDRIHASDRFKQGIDPWGTPYFYRVEKTAGEGMVMYAVTVRSFGPNRSDDGGSVDDLQRTYQVLVFLDRQGSSRQRGLSTRQGQSCATIQPLNARLSHHRPQRPQSGLDSCGARRF